MQDEVVKKLSEIFNNYNIDIETIDKNLSIIESNTTDSITFVNILFEIEDALNVEINFDEIDMEQLVYIDKLTTYIKSIA